MEITKLSEPQASGGTVSPLRKNWVRCIFRTIRDYLSGEKCSPNLQFDPLSISRNITFSSGKTGIKPSSLQLVCLFSLRTGHTWDIRQRGDWHCKDSPTMKQLILYSSPLCTCSHIIKIPTTPLLSETRPQTQP